MIRLMCAGLVALLCFSSVRAEDKELDVKKLEGKWTFVSGMKKGNDASEEMKKAGLEITKDTMTMTTEMGAFKFKYSIDSKASPATIDLEITEGPVGQGSKSKGIISLDGDDLKLCYMPMGDDRPKKFDDKEANCFVLKKKK